MSAGQANISERLKRVERRGGGLRAGQVSNGEGRGGLLAVQVGVTSYSAISESMFPQRPENARAFPSAGS